MCRTSYAAIAFYVLVKQSELNNIAFTFCFVGIEDGQTVRLNVGEQELFVTFRVCISFKVDF